MKKLGSGGRFKELTAKIEKQGKSPESAKKIAAAAGIAKYGKAKMEQMAKSGKKRKSK